MGGTIPLPTENTSSIDGRWHFYHDLGSNFVNFIEAEAFCGQFGAHLPIIRDEEEHQRVIQRVQVRDLTNAEA